MKLNIFRKLSICFFVFGIFFIPNFSHALTTLLTDDFTGTTIDTGKWNMIGGTAGVDYIQNGNINVRNSGGTINNPGSVTSLQSASSFPKGDDLTISANITNTTGNGYLGYGNYSGGTYYYIVINASLGYDAYIRSGGSYYTGNTSCGGYTAGAKITMKVLADNFEVYKNDIFQCTLSVDGASPVMTSHPVFLKGSTTGTSFDNVLVTNTTSAPPATVPEAISNLAASEWGNTTTNLTWSAPSNGGDAITDYTVDYRISGNVSWTNFSDGVSSSTGATVTGLTNENTYEFRVRAINGIGTASDSNIASVLVRAPQIPSTPSQPSASAVFDINGGKVNVSFSAPSANGSGITSYTVTASNGGGTQVVASSPASFTGLNTSTSYTFTVTATNGVGTSSSSIASSSVTPSAFPDGTIIWTERSNSGSRNWYDAKISTDGTKLVAVVNGGYIYTSTDSGANWTERTDAGSRAWTDIASSSDGTYLVAVSSASVAYYSTNSGANWTQSYYTPTHPLYAVANSSDGSRAYLGPGNPSSSYISRSSDYGANFEGSSSSPSMYYADIDTSADGSIVFTGSSNSSYIYKSTNYSLNWSTLTGSGSRSWRSIANSSNGNHVVASSNGIIVSSIDSGTTWVSETTSTSWRGVDMSPDGISIVAVREGGYIYTGVIDMVPPTITNISSNKTNGTYATGEVIDIDVTFSEAVTSTGNVTITLETGTTDQTCTFTVSNSDTGTCNYTVVVGDNTLDLNVSSVSGVIKDSSLNTLVDFIPVTNLATNKSIVVDAIPPVISSVATVNTNTTSTISWITDKVASSYIEYGLTSSYGTTTAEINITPRVLSHEVLLSNLVKCTTYFYRTRSRDAALNPGTSSAGSFTTMGCVGGASVEDVSAENITTLSGGTTSLTYDSTTLSLNIPPDSTNTDAVFQIKVLGKDDVIDASGEPEGDLIQADTDLFDLKAYTAVDTKVSTFDEPIEITMSYDTADIVGIDESSLKIYRYDETDWFLTDDCNVDTNANEITCNTNDFSIFSVFGTAPVININNNPGGAVSVAFLQELSDRMRAQGNGCITNNLYSTTTGLPCNQNSQPKSNACEILPELPKVLKLKNNHNSVKILQQILNCKGFTISTIGAGSKAKETTLFGQKTKEAVIKFQKANNLKGDGIVGPNTRKILNN